MDISVIIPIKNEAKNIMPLFLETSKVLSRHYYNYEIIFVSSGSTDLSDKILTNISHKHFHLKYVKNKNIITKSSAIRLGFKHSLGEKVILMDGDFQYSPLDIPKIINELQNYDIICGWRYIRYDSTLDNLKSFIGNTLRGMTIKNNCKDPGCGLKGFRRTALEKLFSKSNLFADLEHFFYAELAEINNLSVKDCVIQHFNRYEGKTKFRISTNFISNCFLATTRIRTLQIHYGTMPPLKKQVQETFRLWLHFFQLAYNKAALLLKAN